MGMAANPYESTIIAEYVAGKATKGGKNLPNGNMSNAHAEIGLIQQAYRAGETQNAEMVIDVWHQAVCGHCYGNVAIAAQNAMLKQLIVNEIHTGNSYIWTPGMRNLGEAK